MEAQKTKLRVQDFSVFYGDFQALRDITIVIPIHQITAIIGPSGCGKSTFIRAFNRMNDLIPTSHAKGGIFMDGQDLCEIDAVELRKRVGMVFQRPNPFPKTIFDNVAYGPRVHGLRDRVKLAEIVERSLRDAVLWNEVKDDCERVVFTVTGKMVEMDVEDKGFESLT